MKECLTVAEAAKELRVCRATVQRALQAGRLPGAKVGRAYRIPRVALDRYLNGNAYQFYRPEKRPIPPRAE